MEFEGFSKLKDRVLKKFKFRMETMSPYLEAVQDLPGKIPGQKYKELNLIAQRIVDRSKTNGDSVAVVRDDDVPEPLRPLVQLEISNILRQYDGVIEALKSEDSVLINRAMGMNWFFRGTNKDIVSVEYFEKNLLPFVSINTRNQLIKRLAKNLRSSGERKVADAFYTHFSRQYERKQAEILLVACSEDFIYDTVTANKIKLPCRILQLLFLTNPNFVIRYLKLFKPSNEESARPYHGSELSEYTDILPWLTKKHSSAFIELLEMHNYSLDRKLGNKAAKHFLKMNVETFLDKPKVYMKILPLKVVAAKLTKPQFKSTVLKMFPKQWQDFSYSRLVNFLQYYPKQERVALVIDLYKEAYNANFLDNTEAIDVYFLDILPQEERARQARIKLAKEPDWRSQGCNVFEAWICYLPINESIPLIKNELSKTSNVNDLTSLMKQMFYSCVVNDDMEALHEALIYFATHHKNEPISVITDVLEDLGRRIDPSRLSIDHWKVLDDLIQFIHVKGKIEDVESLLLAGIHFNLINDLPIDDKIQKLIEFYIHLDTWHPPWSILEEYPEYNRRCLDAFITIIPKKYPKSDEIWEGRRMEIIKQIVKAISNFNTDTANCKIEKLSIKNYPWLSKSVKYLVQTPTEDEQDMQENITSFLKIHEKDLYRDWMVMEPQVIDEKNFGERALQRLNEDPKNILDNWEKYLERAISNAHSPCTQRFIRKTRWHHKIPVKFVKRCLRDLGTEKGSPGALQILGILMEGNEYAQVIEPLLPQDSKIDAADENAEASWEILKNVPKGMNLTNPPVPLELIHRLCQGDYLRLGLITLTNACRRTSINKIEPFIKTLVDQRVTTKKYEIRLFCLVASTDELRTFLSKLWKTEKRKSFRAVIFKQIYSLFIVQPNPDTWDIMKTCIADLTVDDADYPHLCKITNFHVIPVEYVGDYIKQLLETLEKLKDNGFDERTATQLISDVLKKIDESIGDHFPEDVCQQLLLKYFCNPNLHPDVSAAGMHFVLNGYLPHAGEKFEARLELLCKHYEDVLKKHWKIPHPEDSCSLPVNYLAHDFITSLVRLSSKNKIVKSRIMESVLKSFLTVLKPECDFVAYGLLTYGIALKDAQTPREIVNKIGETLPKLVEVLSPEMVTFFADVVKTWLRILVESDKVEEVMYDVIENLCEIGTDHACLLATKMLSLCKKRQFEDRHSKIIGVLREVKYPAVVSLVYLHANTRRFSKRNKEFGMRSRRV